MLTRNSRQVQAANHRWTGSKATKTCKAPGERGRCFVKDRESTGVMEMMGVHKWLKWFGSQCRGRRVHLDVDNSSVVLAVEGLYSPKREMMTEIVAIAGLICEYNITLRIRHVMGKDFNVVADHLSHDRVEEACTAAVKELGLPLWFQ